ncbi:MAG: nitroreductase family protein, partial [Chloroflexota bacterium]|nr:nitroreductase family protein [Chloroflexota bacterium]
TAIDEGLGCCFVGAYRDDEVSRILGLPAWVRPVGIIPVGHPAEGPARLSRIPLRDVVHEERWSGD